MSHRMWPFTKCRRTEPDDDPALQFAEQHVAHLTRRANHVERVLRPRHDRNHWSETVQHLYERGRTAP